MAAAAPLDTLHPDAFLTKQDIARRMKCSTRTVDRWLRPSAGRNRLHAFTVGGIIRVRPSVFERWVAARTGGRA